MRKVCFLAAMLCLLASQAMAGDFDAVRSRLAADGVSQAELAKVFDNPQVRFTPDPMGKKLLEMYTAKYGSLVVRRLQTRLGELGYFFGQATGRPDFLFRRGVKAFQRDNSLPEDGRFGAALLAAAESQTRQASAEIQKELKDLAAQGPPDVYEAIVSPERLAEARAFFEANKPLLEEVRQRFGVPPEAAVGLLSMETRMGKFLGDNLAVNNLASMAASPSSAKVMGWLEGEDVTPARLAWLDAKATDKAGWAYSELKALFTYARLNNLDLTTMPGSIYGAIGVSQFMPSSLLRFGVDGGDGRVDIFRVRDAALSMGNYLQSHGLTGDLDNDSSLRAALFRYNHSETYVNTIMAVARFLKDGTAP